MGDDDVTLRALSLGAQDATTGWYDADRSTESTIDMVIVPKGTTFHYLGIGFYAKHDYTGYTTNAVSEGDEIKDQANRYYEIQTVTYIPFLNSLAFYECQLNYKPLHADRPSTSGTWKTVGSATWDAAHRAKMFLDTAPTGIISANLKEDDNATNATWITAFAFPDYPLSKVFINKAVDLIFSIADTRTTAMIDSDLSAYGYQWEVTIDLCSIDKIGLTARRLVSDGERELQRIMENTPTGSLRSYSRGELKPDPNGSLMFWHKQVVMNYQRSITE